MTFMTPLMRASRAQGAANLLRRTTGGVRFYTGPTVDYEHFTSGWGTAEGDEERRRPGRYTTQTFNKISPTVGSWEWFECRQWFLSISILLLMS
jgi:hypothetical protein